MCGSGAVESLEGIGARVIGDPNKGNLGGSKKYLAQNDLAKEIRE